MSGLPKEDLPAEEKKEAETQLHPKASPIVQPVGKPEDFAPNPEMYIRWPSFLLPHPSLERISQSWLGIQRIPKTRRQTKQLSFGTHILSGPR